MKSGVTFHEPEGLLVMMKGRKPWSTSVWFIDPASHLSYPSSQGYRVVGQVLPTAVGCRGHPKSMARAPVSSISGGPCLNPSCPAATCCRTDEHAHASCQTYVLT